MTLNLELKDGTRFDNVICMVSPSVISCKMLDTTLQQVISAFTSENCSQMILTHIPEQGEVWWEDLVGYSSLKSVNVDPYDSRNVFIRLKKGV